MAEVQEPSKTMKAVLDFYNIPWAKASHTAKDDIKGGNKVYLPSVRREESKYVLNNNLNYHTNWYWKREEFF